MQALELVRAKLAARTAEPLGVPPVAVSQTATSVGKGSQAAEAESEDVMELDDEAIDGMFAMVEEVPEGVNAEQHAAFLAATKAKFKASRRDVASQISGVRKRLKKT